MAQDTLLPIDNLASDRELKQFGSVSVTPAENPDWAYRLILPKTWVQDEDFERIVPKFEEMAQIGLFGAPDAPVGLQVWATVMPFEVDLLDWLKMMAEDGEMELEEIAVRSPDTGQCVEALANVLHGNKSQSIRLTALSNGNKIYFLNGMAEENHYKAFIKPPVRG